MLADEGDDDCDALENGAELSVICEYADVDVNT